MQHRATCSCSRRAEGLSWRLNGAVAPLAGDSLDPGVTDERFADPLH